MILRKISLMTIDAILVNFAVIFAMLMRFDTDVPTQYIQAYVDLIPLITIVNIAAFIWVKMYSRIWEYASISEVWAIIRATVCSEVTIIAIIEMMNLPGLPHSVYLGSAMIICLFIGLSRLSWRMIRDVFLTLENKDDCLRILIVGAGDMGMLLAKEISNNPALKSKPTGFADDDPKKKKMIIAGIPVLGSTKSIPSLVEQYNIDEIIIAMPSVGGESIREIVKTCQQSKAQVKILPGIYYNSAKGLYGNLRQVRMEDLLRRKPVKVDFDEITAYINNKCILITGAGGSIGSELCRQVQILEPSRLVIIDNSENNLFDIEMELADKLSNTELCIEFADVRNKDRINRIFNKYKPQVVFHAAAYKHVPMMERQPDEAIRNNVYGTKNVAELSDKYGVETFVLISTDKAVNPTSMMGASKRIAELVVKDIDRSSKTKFAVVRFGNVLGSRGSVVPTFMKQIEKGGPLTVTHPDMKRFFMTIPEAVQLVIQSGAIAKGGEIFVLDMGEPVKIDDLARDLIKLSGYEPDQDIEIVYTGIRPGEKLYEELFTDKEGLTSTEHERIHISTKPLDMKYLDLSKNIPMLVTKKHYGRAEITKMILDIVPEYQGKTGGREERKAAGDVG